MTVKYIYMVQSSWKRVQAHLPTHLLSNVVSDQVPSARQRVIAVPWIRYVRLQEYLRIKHKCFPNYTDFYTTFCFRRFYGIVNNITAILTSALTAPNWQKWKRVFLTCLCHEIHRVEAVDLKSCKYTWKITIHVKMRNLG